ncbi:CLUMA_CG007593, isoform A [Clunio marinus]|uniref:CLUMA_CG007593, isoform A n=1 Tax=Clunio marinus TaxID=568069 RepID=A0A1J1I581_9DIPT|nr:CLUMA_CG007593, isoform A [Clunio marinus]
MKLLSEKFLRGKVSFETVQGAFFNSKSPTKSLKYDGITSHQKFSFVIFNKQFLAFISRATNLMYNNNLEMLCS